MNRRLQQFLEAENITQAQFAAKVKVAPASISHILAGRNKPGFDFIQNAIAAFPELNIEWLVTGRGKMYKQTASSETTSKRESAIEDRPDSAGVSKYGSGSLFPPIEDTATPQEQDISAPLADTFRNIQPTPAVQAQPIVQQQPVRQRKATRIMVFYDDGTFQEFR